MWICLDPTPLNKAVLRKPFYYHKADDVHNKLAKATCFTVIDFKKGYWQVPLDDESSQLTTFNTPLWCYQLTRLPFGITVSGDTFQRKIDAIYSNLLSGEKNQFSQTMIRHLTDLCKWPGKTIFILVLTKSNTIRTKLNSLVQPIQPKATNQPMTRLKPSQQCTNQQM